MRNEERTILVPIINKYNLKIVNNIRFLLNTTINIVMAVSAEELEVKGQLRHRELISSNVKFQIFFFGTQMPTVAISGRQYFKWPWIWRQLTKPSRRHLILQHRPVVCLTTGSKPLPKRSLHILRSTASSFKWEYPLLSLRSSSSFLRLLPCLLVTSISAFIYPTITCVRRQFICT